LNFFIACGDGFMDFIHLPKNKILKIKIKTFRKLASLPKHCDFNSFNIFNILLFGRWIKSINPSLRNIIHHCQNLLEFILHYGLVSFISFEQSANLCTTLTYEYGWLFVYVSVYVHLQVCHP
jgi:hypothetical protein